MEAEAQATEVTENLVGDESQETGGQSGDAASSETDAEQTQGEGTETKTEPEAQPAAVTKPAKAPWHTIRINELTRQRKEAEEEVQRLRAEVATRQGPASEAAPANNGQVTATQAEIDRRISEGVAAQTRTQQFNDACNNVFNAGSKEFTGADGTLNFKDSMAQLGQVGEIPPHFIEAATALEDGHKVLHHLGNNPELASELLGLSPVKLAVRMTALSAELGKPTPKPVSRTSAPIKPVNGAGRADTDLSRASLDDFMEARNRAAPIKR